MEDVFHSVSLDSLAAALAEAMGVERPRCAQPPMETLLSLVRDNTENGRVDRLFLYNPDAVAMWLFQKYTALFAPVQRHTRLTMPLRTVMPSVTPVCFATMYTGAQPEIHGIRRYEKPVVRTDTLFDSVIRAGKRAAIVCDRECSMGKIFLERDMDYFPLDTVEEINDKAMELIAQDKYDLLAVYNGDYDATMHKFGPEAPQCMAALTGNIAAFDRFARAISAQWTGHDTLLAFAMDHGCHAIDGGCGSHGLDMPEDLDIVHFYGLFPAKTGKTGR